VVAGLEITNEKQQRRAEPQPGSPRKRPAATSRERPMHVLVLCSGNSARSLIAEAILEREGAGRFRAYSAGSTPKARPNAAALRMLDQLGYDTARLHPKSWTEFAGPEAPEMDFVITLCDRAAGEACPDWPGHPLTAHWGVPALTERSGTSEGAQDALKDTYRRLMQRLTAFINLPFEDLSLAQLKERLQTIGRLEGATEMAFSGLPERDT
jgi:protein-tyrosine-phosphatase